MSLAARVGARVRRLAHIADRIDELEHKLDRRSDKRVAKLRRQVDDVKKAVADIDRNVQSLLRRDALAALDAPYPQRLVAERWRGLSQHEEDGLTLALLKELGEPLRRSIEIGCGPNGGNSGFFAAELGWTSLMIDIAPSCTAAAQRLSPDTITAVTCAVGSANVNQIVTEHGFAGDVDFVSIDIDSYDYWVWDALEAARPRMVIVEYNAAFGPDRALTIPEDPALDAQALPKDLQRLWAGASLQALDRVASRKGYRLTAVTPAGVNAYFLRDDVAPQVPALDVRRSWRMYPKLANLLDRLGGDDLLETALRLLAERGYEIVDLDAASVTAAATPASPPSV